MRQFVAGALCGIAVTLVVTMRPVAHAQESSSLPPMFTVGATVGTATNQLGLVNAEALKIAEVRGDWIRVENAHYGAHTELWINASKVAFWFPVEKSWTTP